MEEQRQSPGGNRKRRNKGARRNNNGAAPVLIAARRPDSPLIHRAGHSTIAASAEPRHPVVGRGIQGDSDGVTANGAAVTSVTAVATSGATTGAPVRRAARIVQTTVPQIDERERLRLRLLERLGDSEGRHAISKVADELWSNDFEIPPEQNLQLQLLEHFDEGRVRTAMDVLAQLVRKEPPLKRPVLEQRLRRLEEYAEEAATREAARALRRQIRS